MKKLVTLILAALMLAASVVPVSAEDTLELTEGSHLTLGETYIDGIDGNVTVEELKANFTGSVDVAGKPDSASVATDDIVICGGTSLRALIYGDVNRDGKIALSDVTAVLKKIAKWDIDINEYAADVDKTGTVALGDVTKLLKWIAQWDDISLGNVRMVYSGTKKTAADEDETIDFFFTSSMNKVGETTYKSTGEYSYKMKLARNENESCQLFLVSQANREGLSLSVSDFEYEYGDYTLPCEYFTYRYHNTSMYNYDWVTESAAKTMVPDEDAYPEVLLRPAQTFEMKADRAFGFLFTVKADKNAPAGMYKATLDVKDGDKVIKTADIYTLIWDFTLPDTPYSATSFNISRHDVESRGESYKEYYDFLLNDYKCSAYTLPYKFTDDACDEYLDNPRVTSYVIHGEGYGNQMYLSPDEMRAAYAKLQTKSEWAEKGYFYCVDEPWNDGLLLMRSRWEQVRDILGTDDFKYIVTFNKDTYPVDSTQTDDKLKNYWQLNNIDGVEYLSDFVNMWCPQSDAFETHSRTNLWTDRVMYQKYGEFRPRYESFRERGDTMWWYVCIMPQFPYANLFTCYQGAMSRALFWQQYMVDADGFLYYATTEKWSYITKNQFDIETGDGRLLYCGKVFGTPGPLASYRLVLVRDGFDDFDYLHMAEELYGREAAMKVLQNVTKGIRDYTGSSRDVEAARDALAKMLDGKYGK